MLLHQAVQRGLLGAAALVGDRGAIRQPVRLPTNGSHALVHANACPPPATLRIGALAKHTGRSGHTIRWYEAQGLMPGLRRDVAGRRRYSAEHIGWLDLMARLRATRKSITESSRSEFACRPPAAAYRQRGELTGPATSRRWRRAAIWRPTCTSTHRAACTPARAPQGRRHAERWRRSAPSETVNHHSLDGAPSSDRSVKGGSKFIFRA